MIEITRLAMIEDIFFEYEHNKWASEMKKKYNDCKLEDMFREIYEDTKKMLKSHIRSYEKTFGEKFDINMLKDIMR